MPSWVPASTTFGCLGCTARARTCGSDGNPAVIDSQDPSPARLRYRPVRTSRPGTVSPARPMYRYDCELADAMVSPSLDVRPSGIAETTRAFAPRRLVKPRHDSSGVHHS